MTGVIGINIAIESNVRCLRLDGDASVNSSFDVSTDSSNGFCMGKFRRNYRTTPIYSLPMRG
eukprot:scaffold1124_cov119-Amphora_coffeaeformis.AAC.1